MKIYSDTHIYIYLRHRASDTRGVLECPVHSVDPWVVVCCKGPPQGSRVHPRTPAWIHESLK